jgi:hypothetical protein
MIWQRLRLDPVWRLIPIFAVIFSLMWWFAGYNRDPSAVRAMAWSISGAIFFVWVLLPPLRQRYTLLDVTLPIAGRQLFLSRIAFMLAFVWLPLLAAVAAPLAVRGIRAWPASLAMFQSGALVTVCLMLVQTFRVQAINPPAWLTVPIGLAAFFLLPRIGKGVPPESVAVIVAVLGGCALASAALFLKAWAEVPKSFQLAPAQPVAERIERAGSATPASSWWPVFRALYFRPSQIGPWIFLAAIVAFLFKNIGWPFAGFGGMLLGYPRDLRWLLPLPISPRRLLWLASFHNATAILAGLLAGAALFGFASSHKAGVKTTYDRAEDGLFGHANKSGTLNVDVPAEYWLWATSGSAPMIEAPWGESYHPEMQKWVGLWFYNPYSVDRAASQRYLEWQFLRATEAVYGQPVSLADAAALARMKTIQRQPRMQVIMIIIAALFYLVQMCVAHLAWGKRLGCTRTGLRGFLAATPFLLVFASIWISPPVGSGGLFLFDSLALHLARVLPANLWALALIAVPPIALLYWLAEKLWGEMEFREMRWQVEAAVRRAEVRS